METRGVREAAADFDKLAGSQRKAADSAEVLVRQTDISEKSITRAASKLQALTNANDAVSASGAKLAKIQSLIAAVRADGKEITDANLRALETLRVKHEAAIEATRKSTSHMNDNAKAAGLAKHEWVNLSRQLQDVGTMAAMGASPMMILTSQGAQIADIFSSHRGGVRAALSGLASDLASMVTPARALGAAYVASFVAVEVAAMRATSALASLGEASRASGLAPSKIIGAEIVGARAGLGADQSRAALENAFQQFEQYKRNAGDLKDEIEKIDKSFLGVADRARNAGEFIDAIQQKIRELPREEGLDLSQKLFGQDAGSKLFDSIRDGALSMKALGDQSARVGELNDRLAEEAARVAKQIDEAAAIADGKLLVAFQALGNPVAELKLGWYSVVGAIADAAAQSQVLQGLMQGLLHPIDTLLGAPARVRAALTEQPTPRFGRLVPLQEGQFDLAKRDLLARGFEAQSMTAGESRQRFAERAERERAERERAEREKKHSVRPRHASGISDADHAEERFKSISRELENQLRLTNSQGDAHDRIKLAIDIENKQLALGKGATAAQKDHVADMVTKINEAETAQQRLNKAAESFNQAYGAAAQTLSGGVKDIIHGGRPIDALKKSIESVGDSMLDAGLTGTGPFAKLFGLAGKDGAVGGLFGGLADALGFGGGLETANIKAGVVNVIGGGAGLGKIGGGLSGAASGLIGSIGSLFSGLFSAFEDGGVVGATGGRMVRAPLSAFVGAPHFASGGAVPIIAHAGEVILNAAQQANVSAAIKSAKGAANGNIRQAPTVVVNMSPVFNNADPSTEARLRAQMAEMERGIKRDMPGILALRQARGLWMR
jgi:hypothetical protein